MSYVKQNFVDGQTLSASQLNHIENGLAELENTLGRFTLQEKTVTPGTELQEVTPDEGYYGLSKVVVEAVESGGGSGANGIQVTAVTCKNVARSYATITATATKGEQHNAY